MTQFTGLFDMFNGGGPGASGSTFAGNSPLTNSIADISNLFAGLLNPKQEQDPMRPQMPQAPRPQMPQMPEPMRPQARPNPVMTAPEPVQQMDIQNLSPEELQALLEQMRALGIAV